MQQLAITRSSVIGALAATFLLTTLTGPPRAAVAAPGPCLEEAGAMVITPDCEDATYANPVIDSTTDETTPVAHRRIAGHFAGTDIDFTIYLHPADDRDSWEGRFFQYTYPVTFTPGDSTARASDRAIGFALSSGGYAVQAGASGVSIGYRHTAAIAKYAETIAGDYYGSTEPISGYLYGPSGGSLQTIGAAENTIGVWQGFVPMVQAVPQPSSYQFMGRSAAELILDDEAEAIRDALLPGGSGDPYATLDEAESAMLTELHALGVPWSAWQYPDYLLGLDTDFYGAGLASSSPLANDPGYVTDFWSAPGYLGAEQSPLGERVRAELAERGDTEANRWSIANRFYYRHQVPPVSSGWVGLEQFRDANGAPIPPQRAINPDYGILAASGGAAFDGSVTGKVIAVSNLGDTDALPLHTDWYRKRVETALGATADSTYRVYFNQNSDHQDAPPVSGERSRFLVDWYGTVEQALRDVAAWAEDDVTPPASTSYEIVDGQIVLPETADERGGVQPLVEIDVDGTDSVTVRVGEPVVLEARTEVPEGAGEVVLAEWDLDGDGQYTNTGSEGNQGVFTASGAWDAPGEYFAAIRVASERNGVAGTEHALSRNVARVRVVVLDHAVSAPSSISISGEARVGATLSAEPGSWGPDEVQLSYQWTDDGIPIDGATGRSLRLNADRVGRSVRVVITGALPGAEPVTRTSEPMTIAEGQLASGAPRVDGTPRVGGRLSVDPGSWGPGDVVLDYEWLADGETIAGADGATFTPTGFEAGADVSVRVTGSKPGYSSSTEVSNSVRIVGPGSVASAEEAQPLARTGADSSAIVLALGATSILIGAAIAIAQRAHSTRAINAGSRSRPN